MPLIEPKILLLNPPAPRQAAVIYPLGLAYIAAVLEKEGYNVKVYDLVNYKWDDVQRLIKKEGPTLKKC